MPTVTYNGYTLPLVFGKFDFSINYEILTLECQFLITAATEAAFVAACENAEQTLKIWNKELVVVLGSTEEYRFGHVANTGFLARPTIAKIANQASTARSREYIFSLNCQLPADEVGYNFRQIAHINLSQNSQTRLILYVQGTYTAGGSNSAKQNFDTYGIPWSDGIAATFLGAGNYELLVKQADFDHEIKVLKFSRTYQQKLALTVTYNGYTIPNNYSKFEISKNYTEFKLSCQFAILHSDKDNAETPLRQWNKDLSIYFGATLQYQFSHAGNTGFLAIPNLNLISDTTEDDTLRWYSFSLNIKLPADAPTYGFRQSGTFSLQYESSRRKAITFTCTYTASPGKTALANYLDGSTGAVAWAAGILGLFGGSYDKVSESVSGEQEHKILHGVLVYREVIFSETSAVFNVPSIISATSSFNVEVPQEVGVMHDGTLASPIVVVNLNYSCVIDNTIVTDETKIEETYRTVVRPWLIQRAAAVIGLDARTFAGTNYVCQKENYTVGASNFSFEGNISIIAPRSFDQILAIQETIRTESNMGIIPRKIWNGIAFFYNIYSLGQEEHLTRTLTIVKLGSPPNDPVPVSLSAAKDVAFGGIVGAVGGLSAAGDYLLLDVSKSSEIKQMGLGILEPALKTSFVYVTRWSERYIKVAGTI